MRPEETNQRMALQEEAQQAPTSTVTCSLLSHLLLVKGEGRQISEGREGGWMGGSRDVRFDLWKDEMIRDQRAGEG